VKLRERKLIVSLDQSDNSFVELGFTHIALIDPGDLFTIQSQDGTHELGGAEIATVTEGSRKIAFARVTEFGFKAK